MCKGWYVFFWPGLFSVNPVYLVIVVIDFFFIIQGLKNFSKEARELIMRLQKIDNDNYPEVGDKIILLKHYFDNLVPYVN
jgi:hypothetical protein